MPRMPSPRSASTASARCAAKGGAMTSGETSGTGAFTSTRLRADEIDEVLLILGPSPPVPHVVDGEGAAGANQVDRPAAAIDAVPAADDFLEQVGDAGDPCVIADDARFDARARFDDGITPNDGGADDRRARLDPRARADADRPADVHRRQVDRQVDAPPDSRADLAPRRVHEIQLAVQDHL